MGLGYNGTTGRLTVEIVKGSHFRNLSLGKAPDTYVKLCLVSSMGQEIARSKTSTKRGQPNPLFKETFIFQVRAFSLSLKRFALIQSPPWRRWRYFNSTTSLWWYRSTRSAIWSVTRWSAGSRSASTRRDRRRLSTSTTCATQRTLTVRLASAIWLRGGTCWWWESFLILDDLKSWNFKNSKLFWKWNFFYFSLKSWGKFFGKISKTFHS